MTPQVPPAVIRVAIADDQMLVRAGFAALLAAEDDMEVAGEAADGAAAVRLAHREKPDQRRHRRRWHVSESTVKTHVNRATMKLAARDRAQLVVLAYQSGLARAGW